MSNMQRSKVEARTRRAARIRKKIAGTGERPRLSVYKSNSHVYAQIVDDARGATVAFASTLSKEIRDDVKEKNKTDAAKAVGKLLAEKAKAASVNRVVFDRNGFPYHGRIAAVADAAREAGLEF